MSTNTLIIERTYNAPIEKVWKAITDKNQMKQWYFDLDEFRAEKGFRFSFYGEREGIKFLHKCEVLEAEPVTRLSYSWRYEGYPGNSIVTFDLNRESNNKTRLVLTHSGLDSLVDGHTDFTRDNFAEGWNHIAGESLRNFVEVDHLKKQVTVMATAADLWRTIINPNGAWGNAFGSDTIAITDWLEGSRISWEDAQGNIGARGIVSSRTDNKKLELRYYDETEEVPGEELGDYREIFTIENKSEKEVELIIESGPIQKKYLVSHGAMWDKALQMMKLTAESTS
jgi:uncharacterized protein YndB with AHSA1/START domain